MHQDAAVEQDKYQEYLKLLEYYVQYPAGSYTLNSRGKPKAKPRR